jgi:hypothetical protein
MTMTSPSIDQRSWRGWSHSKFKSSFTLVFMMWTYTRNGRWKSTFPLSSAPLVGVLWWDFREVHCWWRGSDRLSTWWRDRDALGRCCLPPLTHRPASSTTSSVTMASNLVFQRFKLGGLAGVLRYEWLLCLSCSPFFSSFHHLFCYPCHHYPWHAS